MSAYRGHRERSEAIQGDGWIASSLSLLAMAVSDFGGTCG